MRGPAIYPQPPRNPLGLAMWAAWLGVDPENIPDGYKGHTCPDTMARWEKVGQAALDWYEKEAKQCRTA